MTEPLTHTVTPAPADDSDPMDLVTEGARQEALARTRGRQSTAMTRTPEQRAAFARLATQDTPVTVGRPDQVSRARRSGP